MRQFCPHLRWPWLALGAMPCLATCVFSLWCTLRHFGPEYIPTARLKLKRRTLQNAQGLLQLRLNRLQQSSR